VHELVSGFGRGCWWRRARERRQVGLRGGAETLAAGGDHCCSWRREGEVAARWRGGGGTLRRKAEATSVGGGVGAAPASWCLAGAASAAVAVSAASVAAI